LLDRLSTYTVKAKVQAELANIRATFETKREANEEKRKENEEKMKKEKEAKFANMTPKERKKAIERDEKRQKNRVMKKVKVK